MDESIQQELIAVPTTSLSLIAQDVLLEIPSLAQDSPEVLQRKIPSFWAVLTGEVTPPNPQPPRKRGRPRNNRFPTGMRTNTVESLAGKRKAVTHEDRQLIQEKYLDRINSTPDSVSSAINYVAAMYGLSYSQAHDIIKPWAIKGYGHR